MILLLLLLPCISSASSANEPIVLDFFYAESCGSCIPFKHLIIDEFQDNPSYEEILAINLKNVDTEEFLKEWRDDHEYYPYPFVIIYSPFQQSRKIGEFEITTSLLSEIIEEFRFNLDIIPVINSTDLLIADLYYDESLF